MNRKLKKIHEHVIDWLEELINHIHSSITTNLVVETKKHHRDLDPAAHLYLEEESLAINDELKDKQKQITDSKR